jgi:hypothetical protein
VEERERDVQVSGLHGAHAPAHRELAGLPVREALDGVVGEPEGDEEAKALIAPNGTWPGHDEV